MKIIITGGSGLLGQYLNIELAKLYNILTLYNSNPGNCLSFNNLKIDLTDFSQYENIFSSLRPDVVVHTASISRTDLADNLPREYVTAVNVGASQKLAQLCDKYNSKLIYTSTDLVYDGSFGSMLKETDPVNPVSYYAGTKLAGEEKIRETFGNYIILRTALMYGFGLNHSENHFKAMYLNLKAGRPVKLFHDQYRSPLALKNAAVIIAELINKDISAEVINFGGKERVSRFDIGAILCENAGLDPSLLIRTSMYDIDHLPKVADVSMNTDKLKSLGIHQHSIRDSVKNILSETEN